jgi:glycosyltransferase involved in cell wall biosynthesis
MLPMEKKLVSIAMATYNGEKFITRQLDSIFTQTYGPLEVIAVDDCSNDETPTILEEYRKRYGLMVVRNPKRLGFVKNFEKAILLCSGEYIALSTQDDIWLPNKIERLVSSIKKATLICSDVSLIDEHDEVIVPSLERALHIPVPRTENQFTTLVFLDYVRGCSSMFHQSLIPHALPIPEAAMSHDWWLGICATRLRGVTYLPEQLTLYRRHSFNTVGVHELWKLKSALRYFFSSHRKDIFRRERNRIQMYLDKHVYVNQNEEDYLCDLLEHYSLLTKPGFHAKAFWLIFKHRKKVFGDIGLVAKYQYMLGRLVTF